MLNKLKCFIRRRHLWIEWEQFSDRPRKEFHKGKATLKNPECAVCGIRKFK